MTPDRPATATAPLAGTGACDSHVHVLDPTRFPYAMPRGYTPPPASVRDLQAAMARVGATRTVIVQPSVYGVDNACLLDGLTQLGPSVARGIAVIDADTPEDALRRMDRAGVRGVRLNYGIPSARLDASAADAIRGMAARIAPFGWHLQIFAPLAFVDAMATVLQDLPAQVVLDHFAGAHARDGAGHPGLAAVAALLRSGRAYVKLSALHRASRQPPGFLDLAPIARLFAAANPERILWGTDWPHVTSTEGTDPYAPGHVDPFFPADDAADAAALAGWIPDEAARAALFAGNAARLYSF